MERGCWACGPDNRRARRDTRCEGPCDYVLGQALQRGWAVDQAGRGADDCALGLCGDCAGHGALRNSIRRRGRDCARAGLARHCADLRQRGVEDGNLGFGRGTPCVAQDDERGTRAGADAKGVGLGDAQSTIVAAIVSLLEGINFAQRDVGDELGNVGVDAGFDACADVEMLVWRGEIVQGDADAGFEAEDGFENDAAALDCHGKESKLAAVTAVF